MMKGKGIVMAGVLAGILGLAGCSSPDPAPVQSAIASAPGVQDARVVIAHPGAPWNNQSSVTVYVADSSPDSVDAAVRSAVVALSTGSLAGLPVMITVVEGKPSDFSADHPDDGARVKDLSSAAESLGVSLRSPGDYLYLTPDDIARIAGAPQ